VVNLLEKLRTKNREYSRHRECETYRDKEEVINHAFNLFENDGFSVTREGARGVRNLESCASHHFSEYEKNSTSSFA